MKPVIDAMKEKVPIYDKSSNLISIKEDEFNPINIELVYIQVVISKTLQAINSIRAANVSLYNVIGQNQMVSPQ